MKDNQMNERKLFEEFYKTITPAVPNAGYEDITMDAAYLAWKARAKLTTSQVSEPIRMFPMQNPNLPIPWTLAEALYSAYSSVYGTGQSLERMAERGGFGWSEITGIIKDYPQSGIALRKHLEANPLPNLYLHPTTTPQEAISPAIADSWISVNDRLPELVFSDKHETEPMLESARVLTYLGGRYEFDRVFKIGEGEAKFFINNPTHWQPLPSKPTGLE